MIRDGLITVLVLFGGCSDSINSMLGGDSLCFQANVPDGEKAPPFEGGCRATPVCPHKGGFLPHDWCADSIGNEFCTNGVDVSDMDNWGKCCDAKVLGITFDAITDVKTTSKTTLYEMKVANYSDANMFIVGKIWTDLQESVDKEEPRAKQCGYTFVLACADKSLLQRAMDYYQPPHRIEFRHMPDCERFRNGFQGCTPPSSSPLMSQQGDSPVADSLQIYRVRSGLGTPSRVNDLEEHMVEAITASDAERDARRVLPDFRWPPKGSEVTYSNHGIEIEFRLQSHGLFAQARGSKSLDVLKAIAEKAGWLIVNPASLEFVR